MHGVAGSGGTQEMIPSQSKGGATQINPSTLVTDVKSLQRYLTLNWD